jgi:chromosome segregation ATPase
MPPKRKKRGLTAIAASQLRSEMNRIKIENAQLLRERISQEAEIATLKDRLIYCQEQHDMSLIRIGELTGLLRVAEGQVVKAERVKERAKKRAEHVEQLRTLVEERVERAEQELVDRRRSQERMVQQMLGDAIRRSLTGIESLILSAVVPLEPYEDPVEEEDAPLMFREVSQLSEPEQDYGFS